MFKKAAPGVIAFVVLLSLVVAAIAGFRLYQVSDLAIKLLTGQSVQIAAPQIQKRVDEAVKLALDAEALKNHTFIGLQKDEPEEALENE